MLPVKEPYHIQSKTVNIRTPGKPGKEKTKVPRKMQESMQTQDFSFRHISELSFQKELTLKHML